MPSLQTEIAANPYLPFEAEIITRIQEAESVFTWHLRIADDDFRQRYTFQPGQFNMLYLYGVGEVPISIVSSDPQSQTLDHTIRVVGRVTQAMARLQPGDRIGLRGPYGRGWPLQEAENGNVTVITGGLGCAPSVSIIRHIMAQRDQYRRLTILQGVKHAEDLIWREQYEAWQRQPDTHVWLAADVASAGWKGHTGLVTSLFDQAKLVADNATAMICGPEVMMRASADALIKRGFEPGNVWLSMERNMQCAVGHCGHCQFGAQFICRDGPVFPYPVIKPLLAKLGF
jgi:NAD(P)H-flavin reductase